MHYARSNTYVVKLMDGNVQKYPKDWFSGKHDSITLLRLKLLGRLVLEDIKLLPESIYPSFKSMSH